MKHKVAVVYWSGTGNTAAMADAVSAGAKAAGPGEFTKRAFLNGKLDLSQAEAVIDVIKAKSDLGYGSAMAQLQGSLSNEIKRIRKNMADLIADIVAHIEYPEEDLEEPINDEKLTRKINDFAKKLFPETAKYSQIDRHGDEIVIHKQESFNPAEIVENAIKHGITKKANGGFVKISTYETDKHYIIRIIDDGVGFDYTSTENHGSLHNPSTWKFPATIDGTCWSKSACHASGSACAEPTDDQ